MVEPKGNKTSKNKKRPALRTYFFLNGNLHRRLLINRGQDKVLTWNYPEGKRMWYNYTDVLKRHKRAWLTREVCEMVNRKIFTIELAMDRGMIERPQFTYGLNENRKMYQYMWKEEEIMDLLAYLSTIHRGRPRNDGLVRITNLPTPRELRAMLNEEAILYVKDGDTFIPSWKAKDF